MTTFVFDFGAVLFRWQPVELLQQVMPRRATDEASARRWVHDIFQGFGGDWALFDQGLADSDDTAQRIAGRTGLDAVEVRALIDAIPAHLSPLPDTVAMVERLHAAGVPLTYLSNMPAPYADHLESAHPVVGRFADGVFSSRVKLGKPDAAIFALAAERFGRPPGELVFLDDSAANIRAAQAAGWRALQFHDAAQAERELRVAGWWPAAAA